MELLEGKMQGTPNPDDVSTRLQQIAKLARMLPGVALRTLAHHIDVAFLFRAYALTRKDGATGVDGQTAEVYSENLQANLEDLLNHFKSGSYRAPPVRRTYIPKDKDKLRPIGIPTFEDKVLQRAVAMILSAVYEEDFLPCSYGFRPGRSAHQALQVLWDKTMDMHGGWVIELDIENFFDRLDHHHLRQMLDQRVRDGVLRRAIDKWLKAGILADGSLSYPDQGTPQGGVASPILANVYLHEVLDVWFEQMVKPVLDSEAFMIRYADDAVLVFKSERDARRVLKVLPKRFEKFGLTLHPMKTRMVRYTMPPRSHHGKGPGKFEFLGFTHFWGRTRRGTWVPRRKTAPKRLSRSLRQIKEWCRYNRHQPIAWQHRSLVAKLRGHFNYYGVTGNYRSLATYWHQVRRIWRYWLARRSERRQMSWEKFCKLSEQHPLPRPLIFQSVYRGAANP